MRNVSDKICGENQNTHFVFNNVLPKIRAIYDRLWQNTVEADRPQLKM